MSDVVDLTVIEGIDLERGTINTPDETLLANIRHSIRLQHPQVKPQPNQKERICLVGGGPSLAETETELRDLVFAGAKIVTLNGAYRWCIERNFRPSAQVVLDARAENARFVDPAIPDCRYLIASQCHPETWQAVAGRDTWIWHAMSSDNPSRHVLDEYYGEQWHGIGGGTTVAMRALMLLRTLGFLRFELFGIDSCWMGESHHAYQQTENDADARQLFRVQPCNHPELAKQFWCDPWHVKQLEDFLKLIRVHGDKFLIRVHGDGLLAYALQSTAQVEWTQVQEGVS